MKETVKRENLLWYFVITILLILSAIGLKQLFRSISDAAADAVYEQNKIKSVIIDAGHGGKDGGAVSLTGTPEKTLNLEVSKTVSYILHSLGYRVIMTRDTDVELVCPEIGGSRKMQDLMGRLNISRSNPEAIFISIHMNKFTQEKYKGLQVYYSKNNSESKMIADRIQSSVKSTLQNDNERVTKPATSTIFLLDKINSPAVLIECGFISNSDEAALLESFTYRQKLSAVIANGIAAP